VKQVREILARLGVEWRYLEHPGRVTAIRFYTGTLTAAGVPGVTPAA